MDEGTPRDRFRFRDQRDRQTAERLRELVGEGAAQFFEDASHLMSAPETLRTSCHLAAHALREVESALRSAFSPIIDPGTIPKSACGRGHQYRVEHALKQLGIPEDDPLAKAWLELAKEHGGLARLAHRNGLQAARPLAGEVQETLERAMLVVERVLDRVETAWHGVLANLDALAAKPYPTGADASTLLQRLPNTLRTRQLFFSKVTNPAWIPFLLEAKVFAQPPPPVLDETEGTIAFPFWPEGEYLVRMAGAEDAAVHALILRAVAQVPERTENVRVHEELAAIALALPPRLATGLVPRLCSLLPLSYFSRFAERLAQLAVRLAEAGEADSAFLIAERVLGLDADPDEASYEPLGPKEYRMGPQPRPRVPAMLYDHVGEIIIPPLQKVFPRRSIALLQQLLMETIRLSRRRIDSGPTDYSHVWWPNLEDTPRHGQHEPQIVLLAALRDGIRKLVGAEPGSLPNLVTSLLEQPARIFHRLALYFLRLEAAPDSEQLSAAMMDTNAIDDLDLDWDYRQLLKERFADLPADQRERVAEDLARALPHDEVVRRLQLRGVNEPREEDIREYHAHHLADRLAPIDAHLSGTLRERFEAVRDYAPAETSPGFPTAEVVAAQSPMSTHELLALTDEALVEYLSQVELGDDHFAPSRRGLGDAVHHAVVQSPTRLAALAPRLAGLDPAYLSGYFGGLEQVVKSGVAFAWDGPLSLARQLTARPRQALVRPSARAPDEGWSRAAIIRFVEAGMDQEAHGFTEVHRSGVWEVIHGLLRDPDPTVERAQAKTSLDDQLSLALNSVRGAAAGAIPRYVSWCARLLKTSGIENLRFEHMPEVRIALEELMRPESEPVSALRYFLGERFGWWHRLDSSWAAEHRDGIFPLGPSRAEDLAVTWGTYLRYQDVGLHLFPVLQPVYAHSAEQIGPNLEKDDFAVAERLGFHLCKLAWLGAIPIGEAASPLTVFFARAQTRLRLAVLDEVGRLLYRGQDLLPPEAARLFLALWEWRRRSVEESPGVEADELAAFGWWFVSSKLPDEWALTELEHAARLAGGLEAAHLVVERLATLAMNQAPASLRCLELILVGERKGFKFDLSLNHARTVVTAALASDQLAVRSQARELANRFLARGFDGFRDLASGSA